MKLDKLPLERIVLVLMFVSYLIYWGADRWKSGEIYAEIAPFEQGENVAVFAGYSADGTISGYVVDYLKKLHKIAPNIVFVTDNPIKKAEIKKIEPYVKVVWAERHGEYDWGSYKRGVALLKQKGAFDKLILANDSVLAVADDFVPLLSDMQNKGVDFYGITANVDGTYHLQSYFLIFKPEVWGHSAFSQYLNEVKPEKDGMAVAFRYEVPLTGYLESLGFQSGVLLNYDDLAGLPLNDKSCYPLTLLSQYHAPFLKMRTFTNRLTVQESRRLLFNWLKKNKPESYALLVTHLKKINSPYLKDNH